MRHFDVPYVNFAAKTEPIREPLVSSFERVLDSGNYFLGPECRSFETEFANDLGVPFATGTSKGTCAMNMGLRRAAA